MCEENSQIESAPKVEEVEQEKIAEEVLYETKDMKSKKFIAYIIAVVVGLFGFIGVYIHSFDVSSYQKFLDFLLYSLIAYIGGNSLGKITSKIGK